MGFFRRILDAILPDRGRKPTQLAQWLGVSESEVRAWLSGPPNAAFSYRRYTIPKRRGGERIIDAPSDDLKLLQRLVLQKLLNHLPVHPAATGFARGRSILDNAQPHVGRGVVINIDLANFFHSISRERVIEAWRGIGWSRESSRILANICTHEGRLPQGAPSSPALSNLVCRKLDKRIAALTAKLQFLYFDPRKGLQSLPETSGNVPAAYTRYADDLTFSFVRFGRNKRRRRKPRGTPYVSKPPVVGRSFLRTIRMILEDEGFRIQKKKRVRIQRAHQRQTATGLVVNQQVNLPREVRRRIRAMQHRQRLGQLTPSRQRELAGWESLAAMVRQQGGGSGH